MYLSPANSTSAAGPARWHAKIIKISNFCLTFWLPSTWIISRTVKEADFSHNLRSADSAVLGVLAKHEPTYSHPSIVIKVSMKPTSEAKPLTTLRHNEWHPCTPCTHVRCTIPQWCVQQPLKGSAVRQLKCTEVCVVFTTHIT